MEGPPIHGGNVAQTEQPNGDTVYNLYDLTDLPTSTQIDPSPVGKSQAETTPTYETYGYDAAGNQVTHTDADNRTVQDVATAPGPGETTVITTTNTLTSTATPCPGRAKPSPRRVPCRPRPTAPPSTPPTARPARRTTA